MDNLIIRDFSLSRDFGSIAWGPTIGHNLLRSFCAGLVFSVLGLFTGPPQGMSMVPNFILPLFFPVIYLIVFLPLGLVCAFLARFLPFVGLVTLVSAIFVIPGDPIVWILSLTAPQFVPMHKPAFITPSLIIWLLKSGDAVDLTVSDQRQSSQPLPQQPAAQINPRGVNKL